MMNKKASRIVLGLVVVVILGVCRAVQRDTALASAVKPALAGTQGASVESQGALGESAYPLPPTAEPSEADGGIAPAYPPPPADEPTPLPPDVEPLPSPTPELSSIARQALAHTERLYGVSAEDLSVADEVQVTLPLTQRSYWWVSLIDPVAIEEYRVAVDEDGALVDADLLEAEETAAHRARYGKLDRALYDLLQEEGDEDELIRVAIWLNDIDHEAIDRRIKDRYADVPLEGIRPATETSREAYDALYEERQDARGQSYVQSNGAVADDLRSDGYDVSFVSRAAPLVFVSIPRSDIASLAERSDVQALFLEQTYQPLLETAAQSDEADIVWNRGYDGSGVWVAIVERPGVDFSHPDLATGLYYDSVNPQIDIESVSLPKVPRPSGG